VDEVRVSRVVRPQYASADPLPKEARPRLEARRRFEFDPEASKAALRLDPSGTVIVTPARTAEAWTQEAAALLRDYLRKASGAERGFEIMVEPGDAKAKAAIALGRTQYVNDEEIEGLWQDGFVIRRKANVVVVCGGKSRGTFLGAVAFLDRFCGVRFYMPGELFTSLPAEPRLVVPGGVDIRDEPYVKATSMSGGGGAPGLGEWRKRNNAYSRAGLAGTHQHNMWAAFPPERYAGRYPEIYPLVKGARYIPKDAADQQWNPCFSEPRLLDAAEETLAAYYRRQPKHLWFSFGCQDSHVACECARCQAFYAPFVKADAKEGKERAVSELYWRFMNKLAERIEAKLPGKRIEGLGYGVTRFPPPFKLHPNVVVFTNLHIAELEADEILEARGGGRGRLEEWLDVASAYGNHDWYHGNGYLIPRIYSGYWSRFMRRLKSRIPVTYQHAEMYWNWGLDGPKAWVLCRLWWNPEADAEALLGQFCADMFGPAAEAMKVYFAGLEKLWARLDNIEGPERKLNRWDTQFVTSAQGREMIAACREALDKAAGLARTETQKKRVELFSKTFRLSEGLFALAAAEKWDPSRAEALVKYAREVVAQDPMTTMTTGEALVKQVEAAVKAVAGKKVGR
ncbi:MAG TPA: DUF4838 domain-containing protein, partial [Candidatus Brocadiia bacterium]|nr:DUF4838 domain-containing protein [Candidatus Brocadiia bacterium]